MAGIIVVAGLSTDVGKTTAAAAIAKLLTSRGKEVVVVKVARLQQRRPVGDMGTIEALTGVPGVDLSQEPDPIQAVRDLAAKGKTVVVEGSGGLRVPLIGERTIAHVAAELDAHLVVVSGMAPDSVELAVEAVEFARSCGADVAGILGGKLPRGADLRTRLILMEVSRATGVPFIGSIKEGAGELDNQLEFAQQLSTIHLPEDL